MDELVRQIGFLKTRPGAITDLLPRLRVLYSKGDLRGMVKLLNTRKYQTGRCYRVITYGDGSVSVDWERR